jgi:hypothetical protein
MPKFVFDRRTGQMSIAQPPDRPTAVEMRQKVERVHGPLIKRAGITDQYIKDLIDDVLTGTRNINYLKADTAAKREIAFFVLRELGN